MANADGMRCEPIVDEAGEVIAVARVSGDLGEKGRAALLALVEAAQRDMDAADPSRVARREAAQVRNAERLRRIRGGAR